MTWLKRRREPADPSLAVPAGSGRASSASPDPAATRPSERRAGWPGRSRLTNCGEPTRFLKQYRLACIVHSSAGRAPAFPPNETGADFPPSPGPGSFHFHSGSCPLQKPVRRMPVSGAPSASPALRACARVAKKVPVWHRFWQNRGLPSPAPSVVRAKPQVITSRP